jgi:nucleoside 2-deoxyribosyltransferase
VKKRVYIAGPMTGIPEYNFPAFHDAADLWRQAGWEVLNPAESCDGNTELPYYHYVLHDIELIKTCDAIALLDGWDGPNARGSCWERGIAEKMLGLDVYEAMTMRLLYAKPAHATESALQEAQRLVHGNRGDDYGHPIHDFSRTAQIWSAILGVEVKPEQVALCMVGVKISRECNKPKRDNRVDGAGYFETLQMIYDYRDKHAA